VVLARPLSTVNTNPAASCNKLTTAEQLPIAKPDIR